MRAHTFFQMRKLKRASVVLTLGIVGGVGGTAMSRGEGQVERRSYAEKRRKMCLIKMNDPGLEGEGCTRGERE